MSAVNLNMYASEEGEQVDKAECVIPMEVGRSLKGG